MNDDYTQQLQFVAAASDFPPDFPLVHLNGWLWLVTQYDINL